MACGNEALQALSFNETSDIFPRIRRVSCGCTYRIISPLSPRFIAESDTRRCIENSVANDDNAVGFVQNPGIGGDGMCNSSRYASNHSFPVFWRGEILEILYSVDGRMQRCNC